MEHYVVIDDPGFFTSTLERCRLQPSMLLQKGSYVSDPVNKSNLVVTEVFMSQVNPLSWSYLSGHEFALAKACIQLLGIVLK